MEARFSSWNREIINFQRNQLRSSSLEPTPQPVSKLKPKQKPKPKQKQKRDMQLGENGSALLLLYMRFLTNKMPEVIEFFENGLGIEKDIDADEDASED